MREINLMKSSRGEGEEEEGASRGRDLGKEK